MLVRRLAIANVVLLVIVVALFLIAIGQRKLPSEADLTMTNVYLNNVLPIAILTDTQTASARIAAETVAASQTAAAETAIGAWTFPRSLTLTAIANMPADSLCFLNLSAQPQPERTDAIHQMFVE